MRPLTAEWIKKAEGDFVCANRELRARRSPNYDAACFHAQQCIERYLKAVLQEADIPFGKTHDLAALLDQVLPLEPDWETFRKGLDDLTSFAVEVRYPGQYADKASAREAVQLCGRVRSVARKRLGLREARRRKRTSGKPRSARATGARPRRRK